MARDPARVVEPGHVPGAIDELQLATGQHIDYPPPEVHRAHRIGCAVDQERWRPMAASSASSKVSPGRSPLRQLTMERTLSRSLRIESVSPLGRDPPPNVVLGYSTPTP